jgi:hypothetical protein
MHKLKIPLSAVAIILASCGGGSSPIQTLVNQALDIPTIAVKSDGQTLEANSLRQVVSGNLTLIRELKTFDNEDNEYTVQIAWTINESSSVYFSFREGNYVTNPEAPIGNQIVIPVYTVNVLQPEFGGAAIDATLTAVGTIVDGTSSFTATRTFLLKVEPEAVDSSLIPLITLGSDFTRLTTEGLPYIDEIIQGAPRSSRNAAIVRARGYVTGIMSDWNIAYISSGEYGLALFRPDVSYRDAFALGDFIEVTGEVTTFNGSRQLSWMSSVKFVPATDPLPVVRQLTASMFSSISNANNSQRFRDGSVVTLGNLQFDQITSGLPNDYVEGESPFRSSNHITIRLKVIDGSNSYNISLYLNYRLGITKRDSMFDIIKQAPLGSDKFLTFTGILGWNFGPQFVALEVSDFSIS